MRPSYAPSTGMRRGRGSASAHASRLCTAICSRIGTIYESIRLRQRLLQSREANLIAGAVEVQRHREDPKSPKIGRTMSRDGKPRETTFVPNHPRLGSGVVVVHACHRRDGHDAACAELRRAGSDATDRSAVGQRKPPAARVLQRRHGRRRGARGGKCREENDSDPGEHYDVAVPGTSAFPLTKHFVTSRFCDAGADVGLFTI